MNRSRPRFSSVIVVGAALLCIAGFDCNDTGSRTKGSAAPVSAGPPVTVKIIRVPKGPIIKGLIHPSKLSRAALSIRNNTTQTIAVPVDQVHGRLLLYEGGGDSLITDTLNYGSEHQGPVTVEDLVFIPPKKSTIVTVPLINVGSVLEPGTYSLKAQILGIDEDQVGAEQWRAIKKVLRARNAQIFRRPRTESAAVKWSIVPERAAVRKQ